MSEGSPTPDSLPAHHHRPRPGAPPAAARRRRRRTVLAAAAAVLVLLTAGTGAVVVLTGPDTGSGPAARWEPGTGSGPPTAAPSSPGPAPPPTVTLAATGDIVLGNTGSLPPDDGAGFFDGVAEALTADLVMGNLEQPLTGDTGHEKCDEDSTACHAFRVPTHYAGHLRDGGFHLMNLANNHGNDYGPAGRDNTRDALEEHGIRHTGERDQIAVIDVEQEGGGVSVAVVGFSPYAWTNNLIDLDQASRVVAEAADQADVVVVQAHMGAEGADATRVTPGTETYFEENRGDPMAFSRAVIDAGADLVVGHGPHVLRALEFYQGRLIAYSLGNFAGGGRILNADGDLGLGAVLQVELRTDGAFAAGELISTHMYDAGLPQVDPEQRGLALVRELTAEDFPETGATLGPDGTISAPT